ncbi:MAG: DUF4290 domain-containing protein [Bacteroidetes bacterium]|nr:MAG: DUF4290 domain-containing protein [Bacteroidota bacterium]
MDYNTTRSKLVLPEYGRNIQKMVEYALTIEDKTERNKIANAIITILGNKKNHLRDIPDFKHKLWDHLAIMSDFKLDFDSPFPIPEKKDFNKKPNQIPYKSDNIKFKHYGTNVKLFIQQAIETENETKRNDLILIIANHMKYLYLKWNRDAVTDEIILNDLEKLSDGKLKIDKTLLLTSSRELASRTRKIKRTQKK